MGSLLRAREQGATRRNSRPLVTSRNAVSAEKDRNRTVNDECQQPLLTTTSMPPGLSGPGYITGGLPGGSNNDPVVPFQSDLPPPRQGIRA